MFDSEALDHQTMGHQTHDEDLILAYAADKWGLDADSLAAVEAQLANCAACRALLDEWRDLADATRLHAQHEALTLPPLAPLSASLPEQASPITVTSYPVVPDPNRTNGSRHDKPHAEPAYPNEEQPMMTQTSLSYPANTRAVYISRRPGVKSPPLTLLATCAAVILFALVIGFPRYTHDSPIWSAATPPTQDDNVGTVYDILHETPRFSQFAELVDQDDLIRQILSGSDPVTLFVMPNDETAFTLARLPQNENLDLPLLLLASHVVIGEWTSETLREIAETSPNTVDLENIDQYMGTWQAYNTASGEWHNGDLSLRTAVVPLPGENGGIIIKNPESPVQVNVIEADILASNGVIHVVDGPLLADDLFFDPLTFRDTHNIYTHLANDPELSTFVAAIDRSFWFKQVITEQNARPGSLPSANPAVMMALTIFAPTNAAFEAYLDGRDLNDLTRPEIDRILTAHVVQGLWSSTMLKEAKSIRITWEDSGYVYSSRLTIESARLDDGETWPNAPFINGLAHVERGDIITSNGVLHVVDSLLITPDSALESE